MKNLKRTVSIFLILILAALGAAGCSKKDNTDESGAPSESSAETNAAVAEAGTPLQKVSPDEAALTVGDDQMTAMELFYLYCSAKLTFEMSYGITDWNDSIMEGYTYADYLKSTVESQALNLIYLKQKAAQMGIELTEEEKTACQDNAQAAMEAIDQETIDAYGFTAENMAAVNEDMYLANNVITALQDEALNNLTDEEKASCQYRAIQHILISTMDTTITDENGESETMDSEAEAAYREAQKALAEQVLERAKSGEDFEALAEEFTADSGVGYSINASGQTPDGATMVEAFAQAANALGEGEISDLVETEYGYHIIKCVSLNDEDANTQAMQNLAYTNVSSAYSEWLSGVSYSFYDTWKNYVVVNPQAADDTADTVGDGTAADDGVADDSAADDGAADDTAADDTEADE